MDVSKINLADFGAKLIYFSLSIRKLHIYERVSFILAPEGYIELGRTAAAKNDVIIPKPLEKIQRTNFELQHSFQMGIKWTCISVSFHNIDYERINIERTFLFEKNFKLKYRRHKRTIRARKNVPLSKTIEHMYRSTK